MSESLSIDDNWEEPLDSDQVTHVKGEIAAAYAAVGEWLVNVSEQVIVPMATADVVEAVRAGRVTDRSLVWRAGMADWAALGDVPPLRLAVGHAASAPAPAAPVTPIAPRVVERAAQPASERVLHPPPKEPARAARDERARRNTLPFGFPVARDPATIREPAGLHAPAPAPARVKPATEPVRSEPVRSEPVPKKRDDSGALAIYERAAPSLTFSDSVRAEWEGNGHLVHQAAPSAVSAPSAPPPAPVPRPRPELRPEPKPRLSLEPQSDPMQSARAEAEPLAPRSQPPSSLAPTTSEPRNAAPRSANANPWGDLSVVLARDMRAAKASSKRVTLLASVGSAALASLLTLWLAHSSADHGAASTTAAQPVIATAAAVVATAPVAATTPAAPLGAVSPSAVESARPTPAASSVAHAAAKPMIAAPRVAPVRVVSRPKPVPAPEAPTEAAASAAESDPYADPVAPPAAKTPTAAFKEAPATPSATAPAESSTAKPKAPGTASTASGLEDSAGAAHPAPTAVPGF